MKNRKDRRSSHVLTYVFALSLAGLGGYYCYYLFTPASIVVTYEHIYSQVVKNDIDRFAKKHLSSADFASFNQREFCKKLKDRFSIVKEVCLSWESFDRAFVTIQGVKPVFSVNKKFIFGDKKCLFPYSMFCSVTGQKFRSLDLNPELVGEKLPARIYEFVQNIPDDCWSDYSVSYSGQNYVLLGKSEKKTKLRLVVDEETLKSSDKMEIIPFVHDDFVNRKNLGGKRGNRKIAYDLRFKDRIYAKITRN